MGMVLALIIELNLLSMGMYLPSSEFWMRNATETITLSYAMVLIFAAAFIFLNTMLYKKTKLKYPDAEFRNYMLVTITALILPNLVFYKRILSAISSVFLLLER